MRLVLAAAAMAGCLGKADPNEGDGCTDVTASRDAIETGPEYWCADPTYFDCDDRDFCGSPVDAREDRAMLCVLCRGGAPTQACYCALSDSQGAVKICTEEPAEVSHDDFVAFCEGPAPT